MGSLNGLLRIRVLERDGYACVYCGRRPPEVALEVDHVLPKLHGGRDEATNLVTACRGCNNGKRTNLISLPAGYQPGDVERGPARRFYRRASGYNPPVRYGQSVPRANCGVGCDLCGRRANTAHFVPWVDLWPDSPMSFQDVFFACPAHDAGGYWVSLRELDQDSSMRDHILTKHGGAIVLARLDERLIGASDTHAPAGMSGIRPHPETPVRWWDIAADKPVSVAS